MQDEFEEVTKKVMKMFKERGVKILEKAEASIKDEKIECAEAKGALIHFISYFRDFVRPSLLSLACEAVGGNPESTIQIGKSLILLSGAFDVHDDIIDKTMYRGGETVVGKFGSDIALLAGDALIFKGLAELFEGLEQLNLPTDKKLAIVRTIKEMYFELGDAEALELKFRGRTDVTPEEYLRMVRKKAADVEAYMKVGAMLGGGRVREIKALGEYGRILGMLVILRDDVEDLLDFEVELPSRIKNESLPTPILYALENEEVKAGVTAVLKKEQINEGDAEALISSITKAKGFERLWKFFDRLGTQAGHEVEKFDEKWKMAFKLILKAVVPPIPKDLVVKRCS
jgi:geranylgeranyl diphosphate synthase type I